LFGYAASGFKIRLFALTRGINDAAGANTFQLGLFNLEDVADRFRMLLALLNLCLLFPAITEECPDSGRNEYRNISRSSGVVVRLNPTYIEKVFPNEEGFDQLELIYRIILNGKVPNVDHLIELKRTKKTAKFEPRGTMVKPSNLLELFVALRNVLDALIVLHRELVIHRDIRWSNVIKRRDGDSWFLIDFDDAAISPQYFPNGEHLSEKEHAPEIFVSGSIHTTAVDIWAVGYLIETSNVQWDDFTRRTAFTNRLLQADPTRRPTAEEALCDLAKLEEEAVENSGKPQIKTCKRKQKEKAPKRKKKR
jgi:serine/threonine protein kinase